MLAQLLALVGEPLDADCSIATRVEYLYRTTATTGPPFKPLPEGARPTDLATTTTLDERTVPYVVRVQIGTANFYDPTASVRIAAALPDAMTSLGATTVRDVVGTLNV